VEPILRTSRLLLRHWLPEDAPAYLSIYGDTRVTRNFTRTPIQTIEEARTKIAALIEQGKKQPIHWAVVEATTGELIGNCGFRPPAPDGELEIGFALAADKWGYGYATEIAKAVRDYGFAMGAPRILGLAMPTNTASQTVLQKLGMTYIRTEEHTGFEWLVYGVERAV